MRSEVYTDQDRAADHTHTTRAGWCVCCFADESLQLMSQSEDENPMRTPALSYPLHSVHYCFSVVSYCSAFPINYAAKLCSLNVFVAYVIEFLFTPSAIWTILLQLCLSRSVNAGAN